MSMSYFEEQLKIFFIIIQHFKLLLRIYDTINQKTYRRNQTIIQPNIIQLTLKLR